MSPASSTLHVRDVAASKVRSALVDAMASRGWEPFDSAREMNEHEARRFAIVEAKPWVSLVRDDGATLDDVALPMSKTLAAPVLTIFTWEDEAVVVARRFEAGVERASFELPRDAERGRNGHARVRSTAIEPWLDARAPKSTKGAGGWLVIDEGPDIDPDYVSDDDSLAAISKALRLENVVLDPYDDDRDDATTIHFRPTAEAKARAAGVLAREIARQEEIAESIRPQFKGRMPLLPPRDGAYGDAHRDAYCLADYAARGHALGWIAFDGRGKALEATLLAAARPIVEALLPRTRIDWKRARETLARSEAFDVSEGKVNVWLTLQGTRAESVASTRARVPAVIGWSMPKPSSDVERGALASVMHEAMMRALDTESCVGACVVGAGRARTRGWTSLPYEIIASTDAGALRIAWVRDHVRSPGWRVLVPRPLASRLPKKKAPSTKRWRGPAGVLVGSTALDPFAQLHADAEPLEREMLALVGTPRELRDLLG